VEGKDYRPMIPSFLLPSHPNQRTCLPLRM